MPRRPEMFEPQAKRRRLQEKSKETKSRFRVKGSPRPSKKPGDDDSSEEETSRKPEPPLSSSSSSLSHRPKSTAVIPLPSTFKIIAGSYEKLLYGLEGTVSGSTSSLDCTTQPAYTFHLKPIFIFPAHVSCIKTVSASPHGGKWLATGSSDEIIKIWDLRRRKEVGGLMHHQGSITDLVFPTRTHLLSASEDGTLCVFHARDWTVLRTLKGHKGRVNSIAVHPSGKVALSVGRDKTLRMWDLMRGKGSASTKLGKEGEVVRWSVDGSLFVVQSGSTMDVYKTDMTLIHSIHHPSRLHDVRFCKQSTGDGELLLAAAEDRKLSIYDISPEPNKPPEIIAAMVGHENRVKAVCTMDIALPSLARKSTTIICTASSDGKIQIYDLARLPSHVSGGEKGKILEIEPDVVYDSKGTRLTCVTAADGELLEEMKDPSGEKRKREEEEDEEDEDEDEDEDIS